MKFRKIYFFSFIGLLYCVSNSCVQTEKPLVVVVTSYNNKQWYKRNLDTIFFQDYQNYRIIYIDDCSPDGTGDLVESYIKQLGQEDRCIVIKNKVRVRALANLFYALQLCQDDEIVLNYDGDDWFAHSHVFQLINEIYQDEAVWITYGQFINWPSGQLGYCASVPAEVVEGQLYRKKWWKPGQLRTFYAWLFKQVKLKDLIFTGPYFQGQFFPANSDLAIYYPMMEMAGVHFKFIDEIIYIRNVQTTINDFKVNKEVQIAGSKQIRYQEPYQKLEQSKSGYFDQFAHSKADIIIFSSNESRKLEELLLSIERLICNVGHITVLYRAESAHEQIGYEQLAQIFSHVSFISGSFDTAIKKVITSKHQHLLFAHDGMVFNHAVDLNYCINQLERTYAHAFFLSLSKDCSACHKTGLTQDVPPLIQLEDDLYAWMFNFAEQDWAAYYNIEGTLYRSQDIQAIVQRGCFDSLQKLVQQWSNYSINSNHVGLCFAEPKIGYLTWLT